MEISMNSNLTSPSGASGTPADPTLITSCAGHDPDLRLGPVGADRLTPEVECKIAFSREVCPGVFERKEINIEDRNLYERLNEIRRSIGLDVVSASLVLTLVQK